MNRRGHHITLLCSILFILFLVSTYCTAESFEYSTYELTQLALEEIQAEYGQFPTEAIDQIDLTKRLSKIISEVDFEASTSSAMKPTYKPVPSSENRNQFGNLNPGTQLYTSPYETQAFCARVLNPSYVYYPQHIDIATGKHVDVDCERHIDHQQPLRILAMASTLITDDYLRYLIIRLHCAYYYRPAGEPTRLPCASNCREVFAHMNQYVGTRAQQQDRAVVEHYFLDNMLAHGLCDFVPTVFDPQDNPNQCMHGSDQSIFQPFSPDIVERARCAPYSPPTAPGLCTDMMSNTYHDPLNVGRHALALVAENILPAIYALAPRACLAPLAKTACPLFYHACTERAIYVTDAAGKEFLLHLPVPQYSRQRQCISGECGTALERLIKAIQDSDGIIIPTGSPPDIAISMIGNPECATSRPPLNAYFDCDNVTYAPHRRNNPNSAETLLFSGPDQYWDDFVIAAGMVVAFDFTSQTQPWKDQPLTFVPRVSCPEPLVQSTDPMQTACTQPCPLLLFTSDEYETVSIIAVVLSTISNICILFLFVSYFSFRKNRLGTNFLQFLCCVLCVSISISIGVYIRYDGTKNIAAQLCSSPSQTATQHDIPGCTAQAFFVHFAMLSLCAWWSITAFDLFLRIVLAVNIPRYSADSYLVSLGYWFWGWTIPLLLVSIAAAKESLGPADLSMFYCFVHGRKHEVIPWATAYIPLMVYLFVGCVSLTTTIYSLSRTSRTARGIPTMPTVSLKNYFRPLMLEFALFIVFMYIVIFRAVCYFREDAWKSSAVEFITCRVFAGPYAVITGQTLECGDKPSDSPVVATWILLQCIICSCGTITFFVLGINYDIYRLWCVIIGYYAGIERMMLVGEGTPEFDYYNHKMATQRQDFLAQEKQQLDQQSERPSKSMGANAQQQQTGDVMVIAPNRPPVISGLDGSTSAASSSTPAAGTTSAPSGETKREGRSTSTMPSLAKLAINNQLIIVKPYRKGKVIEYFTNIYEDELPRRRRRRAHHDDEEDSYDANVVDDDYF